MTSAGRRWRSSEQARPADGVGSQTAPVRSYASIPVHRVGLTAGTLSEGPAMSDFSALGPIGYSPRWQALFAQFEGADTYPARVVRADRGSVLIASPDGLCRAKPSTALVTAARGPIDMPAVGDWLVVHAPQGIDVPLIEAVLARTSAITRGDPGEPSVVQILAANVDTVFLVHPIDAEPNLRRIERELSLVWDSGAVPTILLTKADASAAPDAAVAAVQAVAIGCEVLLTSAVSGLGVDLLPRYVEDRKTAVLLGLQEPGSRRSSTRFSARAGRRLVRSA
jgi:ribosome biogenesis GTPase / thiamine phosphate phosphatase